MAGSYKTRADDERVLAILDAKFAQGMGNAEILRRFKITNSALQGMIHRTVKDPTPCACRKRENRDGGMPARWWAA